MNSKLYLILWDVLPLESLLPRTIQPFAVDVLTRTLRRFQLTQPFWGQFFPSWNKLKPALKRHKAVHSWWLVYYYSAPRMSYCSWGPRLFWITEQLKGCWCKPEMLLWGRGLCPRIFVCGFTCKRMISWALGFNMSKSFYSTVILDKAATYNLSQNDIH